MESTHGTARLVAIFVGWSLVGIAFPVTLTTARGADEGAQVRIVADYGKLPMAFEVNQGQADSAVRFLARGPGYGLFLTANEAVLNLRSGAKTASAVESSTSIHMRLVGANRRPQMSGADLLPGISNYFIGNDPAHWHTAVPNYAKVKYAQVYPGVDLVYYGHQRQLEYDFIVAPGADPKRIMLDFKGVKKLALDHAGNLVLATANGELVQHKPIVYQDVDGVRHPIDGRYVLRGKQRASIEVAHYDMTRPLVIDPILAYSTFLGGAGGEKGTAIAVDSSGNAYITGYTSGSFPTTPGAYQTGPPGGAFVTKLNASGTALVYSTYLGAGGFGSAFGIALDGDGNAYVTGTAGAGFPTTPGAYQTCHAGYDVFVTKLNATGTGLVYSTCIGGTGEDRGEGIAIDAGGNAYITGHTNGDFPVTPGAYQTSYGGDVYDAFVTKLNSTGTALVYSTYLGGPNVDYGHGIAVDGSGNAYVTGETGIFPTTPGAYQTTYGGGSTDAFVAKLNPMGTALVYSTYLGGSSSDYGFGIAVDGSGNAYVTGYTTGANFPTTPGAYQTNAILGAFVSKLNSPGTALMYSTYLTGIGTAIGNGIAVDGSGNAYVTGETNGGFPTTPDAPQPAYAGGHSDAFAAKLDASGSALIFSTYLGGTFVDPVGLDGTDVGTGIALDSAGSAYVTGYTTSSHYPTTPGAYQTVFGGGGQDAFVALFADVLPGVRILVPDGTSLQQTFSSYPETRWFAMTVEPGKTYVVETADTDGDLTANAIGTLEVFAPDGVSPAGEASVDCTSANGPRPPAIEVASDGIRCVIRTLPPSSARLNKRPVYVKVTRMDPATGGARSSGFARGKPRSTAAG